MIPSNAYPSLYLKFNRSMLIGMNGIYIDDPLRCGSSEFESIAERTYESFETKGAQELPFTFTRVNTMLQPDFFFVLDRLFYHRKLEILHSIATFSEFRSMLMKLRWLSHTRPNL